MSNVRIYFFLRRLFLLQWVVRTRCLWRPLHLLLPRKTFEMVRTPLNGVQVHLSVPQDTDEEEPVSDEQPKQDPAVDPMVLANQSKRRGSKYSPDGTPLSLMSFLESSAPEIHFFFLYKNDRHSLQPLEEDVERRVVGNKVRIYLNKI